jgi:hypothetical protein
MDQTTIRKDDLDTDQHKTRLEPKPHAPRIGTRCPAAAVAQ